MSAERGGHQEQEKRLDRKVARFAKWGGCGIAVLGALTGVGSLVVPGLIAGTAGWGYEATTRKKNKNL